MTPSIFVTVSEINEFFLPFKQKRIDGTVCQAFSYIWRIKSGVVQKEARVQNRYQHVTLFSLFSILLSL